MTVGECYAVLEVPYGAPAEEIERAYRELTKVWNPERFRDDPRLLERAQAKLERIDRAYTAILERIRAAEDRASTAVVGTLFDSAIASSLRKVVDLAADSIRQEVKNFQAASRAAQKHRDRVMGPFPSDVPEPVPHRPREIRSATAPAGSVSEAGGQYNTTALTGFVLGLTSVVLYGIGVIPILGIVFSSIGLGTFDPKVHKCRWMAGWGLGLSVVYTLMYLGSRG